MESMGSFCVVCGAVTPMDQLTPVELRRVSGERVQSAACPGCMLDVDAVARLNRRREVEEHVVATWQGKRWAVVRR
jgi:hypothetical protein